jgi:hypothetical protein
VLVGGRRVLLLDDRRWSESGPPNIWALTSVEDIVGTARMVVGPDEPFGGRSHEDMEADHCGPTWLGSFGSRGLLWTPWN